MITAWLSRLVGFRKDAVEKSQWTRGGLASLRSESGAGWRSLRADSVRSTAHERTNYARAILFRLDSLTQFGRDCAYPHLALSSG